MGSSWKSLDYQKFFSNGGYSDLSQGDPNILLEDRVDPQYSEKLRLNGNIANPVNFNIIFNPSTNTSELAGRYLLEDGNYILNEANSDRPTGDILTFEDGSVPVLNSQSFGGTYRIDNFKDVYLNSIINPSDGSTKSNYRERRTSESYISINTS